MEDSYNCQHRKGSHKYVLVLKVASRVVVNAAMAAVCWRWSAVHVKGGLGGAAVEGIAALELAAVKGMAAAVAEREVALMGV